MNSLGRLQSWYLAQCNGDWEHTYGVKIDTLDNPGWSLSVDLAGTSLESRNFETFSYGVGETNESSGKGNEWLICRLEDHKFLAYGGPQKLDEMISRFLDWAESKT